jgi:hypothetical protein
MAQSALLGAFEPVAGPLKSCSTWPSFEALGAMVAPRQRERDPSAMRIQFVEARPKPRGALRRARLPATQAYDAQITLAGRVPCVAESYHDLFNAIAWAAFPLAKRLLHARQHAARERHTTAASSSERAPRSREQDALTLFDEGGSVLVVHEQALSAWLRAQQPITIDVRTAATLELVVFGHALMEHVLEGHHGVRSTALVAVTSHALLPEALLNFVDAAVSARLCEAGAFEAPGLDAVAQLVGPLVVQVWPRHLRGTGSEVASGAQAGVG